MNGTLVCGVDASKQGLQAAKLAADVSKRLNLRLVLVHVIHVPGQIAVRPDDEMFWRDRQGANAMLKELAQDAEVDSRSERRVVIGDRAGMLAAIAAEEAADLIVIGAGQRKGLGRKNRFAMQLNAESPIPVLVATGQRRTVEAAHKSVV